LGATLWTLRVRVVDVVADDDVAAVLGVAVDFAAALGVVVLYTAVAHAAVAVVIVESPLALSVVPLPVLMFPCNTLETLWSNEWASWI